MTHAEIQLLCGVLGEVARSAAADVAEYRAPGFGTTWDDRRVGRMLARDPAVASLAPLEPAIADLLVERDTLSERVSQLELEIEIADQRDEAQERLTESRETVAALSAELDAAHQGGAALVVERDAALQEIDRLCVLYLDQAAENEAALAEPRRRLQAIELRIGALAAELDADPSQPTEEDLATIEAALRTVIELQAANLRLTTGAAADADLIRAHQDAVPAYMAHIKHWQERASAAELALARMGISS
jgi:hypothetical protein